MYTYIHDFKKIYIYNIYIYVYEYIHIYLIVYIYVYVYVYVYLYIYIHNCNNYIYMYTFIGYHQLREGSLSSGRLLGVSGDHPHVIPDTLVQDNVENPSMISRKRSTNATVNVPHLCCVVHRKIHYSVRKMTLSHSDFAR